ncbi:MAG: hypothetical protein CMQ45_05885 [Gammaproteobacteria bacterium]|nr:hypothetical protein [Gammaproteobacteria bacterium]
MGLFSNLRLAAFCLAFGSLSQAAEVANENLLGSWEGPLVIGRENVNLAFTFTLEGEKISASMTSSGLGIYGMPADSVTVDGRRLSIRIPRLDLEFTGVMRMAESGNLVLRIDGDWFQYSEMVPVVLLPVEKPSF